jgi:hypothetical protein
VTGRDFALRMLRRLAVQPGQLTANEGLLIERLSRVDLPPAPLVVISSRPTDLGNLLMDGLRRPVTTLAISEPETLDFFDRDAGHAR